MAFLGSPALHRARGPRSVRKLAWATVSAALTMFVVLTVAGSELALRSPRSFTVLRQHAPARFRPSTAAQDPLGGAGRPANCSDGLGPPDASDTDRLAGIRRRYRLGSRLQHLRRQVLFTRRPGLERKRLTAVGQRLVPDANGCPGPLRVDVPASGLPSTVDASQFIFGVSTTYSRFRDPYLSPVRDWTHWLTDGRGRSNGGKLLLTLSKASQKQLLEASATLRRLGVDAEVLPSDPKAEMAVRYAHLVPTIYSYLDPSMPFRWMVLCDDDTFFPSMHALVERFGGLDSSREMYVGALSEDAIAVQRHGSQAFGGAGVFLSLPLARRLSRVYPRCLSADALAAFEKSGGLQGDMILRKCIYDHTETRLTTLPDLWQLDFTGDPAGFYEWGVKPLSLHHYRSWHDARPSHMSRVAHGCGEDCILQRFRTSDDFIISGFSVAHYPEGIDFDANQMEATLRPGVDDRGWNFDYRFGPQRPPLARTGRKLAWELQESAVEPDGSVWQLYIRRRDDARWRDGRDRPLSDLDGVLELVWKSS